MSPAAYLSLIGFVVGLGIYFFLWRFWLFFRDPDRQSPKGDLVLSAADGHIVYIHKFAKGQVPIAIKKNHSINLEELLGEKYDLNEEWYDIGVFMHPTSVHVNRAPVSGQITYQKYIRTGINLPMTIMWFRVLFGMKPHELHSKHIVQNERFVTKIEGKITAFVIQIADIYVNKIDNWLKTGTIVISGQRIGRIIMGSQVDLLIPVKNVRVVARVGQKVYAGKTILAEI